MFAGTEYAAPQLTRQLDLLMHRKCLQRYPAYPPGKQRLRIASARPPLSLLPVRM